MKCVICSKNIGSKENREYSLHSAYVEQLKLTQKWYFQEQDHKCGKHRKKPAHRLYDDYIIRREHYAYAVRGNGKPACAAKTEFVFDWAVVFPRAIFRFATEAQAQVAAERLAKELSAPYPRPPKTWFTAKHISKVTSTSRQTSPSWITEFPGYRWSTEDRDYEREYATVDAARKACDYGYGQPPSAAITEGVANSLRPGKLADGRHSEWWAGPIYDYDLCDEYIYPVSLKVWLEKREGWRCQYVRLPSSSMDTGIDLTWTKNGKQYESIWPDSAPLIVSKDGTRWTLRINDRYVHGDKDERKTRGGMFSRARIEWGHKVLEGYRASVGKGIAERFVA